MRGDDNIRARLQDWRDRLFPIGQDAFQRQLQAFGVRNVDAFVARVAGQIELAAGFQGGGGMS